MKKILIILLLIINCLLSCFSMTQIATTYQTNLTPMDMIEIFVEEINKQNYAWQIGDYRVYTNADEQNYAWAVKIDTSGYTSGYTRVGERSVYLFMKNGWVALKTFGGSTRTGMKDTLDANIEENIYRIKQSLQYAVYNYMEESHKWLNRYMKQYCDDELFALDVLSTIGYWIAWGIMGDGCYRNLYLGSNSEELNDFYSKLIDIAIEKRICCGHEPNSFFEKDLMMSTERHKTSIAYSGKIYGSGTATIYKFINNKVYKIEVEKKLEIGDVKKDTVFGPIHYIWADYYAGGVFLTRVED